LIFSRSGLSATAFAFVGAISVRRGDIQRQTAIVSMKATTVAETSTNQ